jgi:hypothetical protein
MTDPSVDWTREKVTFTAAYGGERISAYLFLPKNTKPPFQSVVFFPSARVNFLSGSADLGDMSFVDYVIKSGRAVIYPVYQKLYERRSTTVTLPGPTLQRATLVDWRKDVGRSIDYLETRDDIDKSRIAYLGVSQGSAYGVVIAASRGSIQGGRLPRRWHVPNRRRDWQDSIRWTSRRGSPNPSSWSMAATMPRSHTRAHKLPLFRMLGTAAADKRHVVFDTPHDVRLRRTDLVREVLDWYDKYLGRVQ